MDTLNLDFVPFIDVKFLLPNTVEDMLKFAEGKSKLNNNIEREGVVIRSMDTSISFKAISMLSGPIPVLNTEILLLPI